MWVLASPLAFLCKALDTLKKFSDSRCLDYKKGEVVEVTTAS